MARDTTLDAYRALAMLHIVCVIHIFYLLGLGHETARSVLLFEMPAIFFIAGASQSLSRNDKGLRETVVNRAWRVLAPFYVSLAVIYAWMALMTVFSEHTEKFNADITQLTLRDVLKTLATGGCPHIPFYGYTWFISCYFIISCSLPLQKKIIKKIPIWAYLALMVAVVATLTPLHFPGEIEIKNLPVYNFFFIAGYAYYRRYSLKALVAVCVVTVAFTVYGFAQGFMMPMQDHKFPADIFFLIFGTAWLTVLALVLRKVRLSYPRILKIWNVRGYNIYLYQLFSFYAVYRLTDPWMAAVGSETLQFFIYAALVFITATVLSYVTFAIEKYVISKAKSLLNT